RVPLPPGESAARQVRVRPAHHAEISPNPHPPFGHLLPAGEGKARMARPTGNPMKNIAQFFVDRPIMAAVLSLLFLITGGIAVFQLPISEYPQVVPPTVVVRATYPGANPEVIAQTVATPLEEQINGVEGMLYSSSQATSDGVMTLTVTFALGTNLNDAQVEVQNRV